MLHRGHSQIGVSRRKGGRQVRPDLHDVDSYLLDSYASTSLRYNQRVLVSGAVQHQWDICTTDISNACLQGDTYRELAEAREVDFVLLAYCVAVLRATPGCEDSDSAT